MDHPPAKEGTLVHYFRREGQFQKLSNERDRKAARAELHYRVERSLRDASLVRVMLVTGLQNQIVSVFRARASRDWRQEISCKGSLGVAHCPCCPACGATAIYASALGRECFNRLRDAAGFSYLSSNHCSRFIARVGNLHKTLRVEKVVGETKIPDTCFIFADIRRRYRRNKGGIHAQLQVSGPSANLTN